MNMIRNIALALLLSVVGLTASAQAHYTSKVAIGGKAGVTLSKMSFAPSTKQSFVVGETMGITVRYWEERHFGLIAELNLEQLGPEVGYMISTSYSSNFDVHNIANIPDFPPNRETDQMVLEPTNKFDYGISGGAGIEFTIKRKHLINLEARYYFGIGNIFPDERRDTFSASRGMSILVTLGYSYRLK